MAIMSRFEMYGHDNDWYCTIEGRPVHIASMGGYIPKRFRDTEVLRPLQERVAQLPLIADIHVQDTFIDNETASGYEYIDELEIDSFLAELNATAPCFNHFTDWPLKKKLYAYTFLEKARMGFYTYALMEGEREIYHLVASPEEPLSADSIESLELQPLNIRQDDFPEKIYIPANNE